MPKIYISIILTVLVLTNKGESNFQKTLKHHQLLMQ